MYNWWLAGCIPQIILLRRYKSGAKVSRFFLLLFMYLQMLKFFHLVDILKNICTNNQLRKTTFRNFTLIPTLLLQHFVLKRLILWQQNYATCFCLSSFISVWMSPECLFLKLLEHKRILYNHVQLSMFIRLFVIVFSLSLKQL